METNGRKRVWQDAETRAFLHSYASRAEEFQHAKKRKVAMAHVLEDLLSRNVLTQPTTEEMLKTKLKNMLQAYKSAKDNSNRTGAGYGHVPFSVELDEIFGDRPIISHSHCRSIPSHTPIRTANEDVLEFNKENFEYVGIDELGPSTSQGKNDGRVMRKEQYLKQKLKLLEAYSEKKLKLAEKTEERKIQRHNERMQVEREKVELLKKILYKQK